jgi:hypothetical protein
MPIKEGTLSMRVLSLKHRHHGEFLYVRLTSYFMPETEERGLTERDIGSLEQKCERLLTLLRAYEI